MDFMYLARYLFPEYSSKEDPSSPRRSRRQRSWGSASSSSANPYDCEYSFSSSQRFRASGIDRRKLEMTLYEKFGHDCQLQITPSYIEVSAERALTPSEILDVSY